MTADTTESYSYSVTVQGIGGEFACVPLTPDHAEYWKDKGNEALATHLTLKGEDDQNVPAAFQLPDYREQAPNYAVGVDLQSGVKVTVQDEEGNVCLELGEDDEGFQERLTEYREIGPFDGPPASPVAMFRTVLKGADIYKITSGQPFDPALFAFSCAEISRFGDAIISVTYNGKEAEFIEGMDREKQDPIAELVSN